MKCVIENLYRIVHSATGESITIGPSDEEGLFKMESNCTDSIWFTIDEIPAMIDVLTRILKEHYKCKRDGGVVPKNDDIPF